jgi:CDP-diacylglycerol---glycerol-3-phosphate 3-phosphatidyltransferase
MNLPNKITLTRLLLIPVFILLFYFLNIPQKKYVLLLLFAFMALTDFADGYVARKTKQVTRLGALLDPIADKLISLTIIIFYVGNGIPAWMAFILLTRDVLILGLRSFAVEYKVDIAVSLMGKVKTAIEMIAFALIILELWFGAWLLGIAMILSIISGIDYIAKAKKQFEKKKILEKIT